MCGRCGAALKSVCVIQMARSPIAAPVHRLRCMGWATCETSGCVASSRRRNAWSGAQQLPLHGWLARLAHWREPQSCCAAVSSWCMGCYLQGSASCAAVQLSAAHTYLYILSLVAWAARLAGRAPPTPPISARTTGSTFLCCIRTGWRTRRQEKSCVAVAAHICAASPHVIQNTSVLRARMVLHRFPRPACTFSCHRFRMPRTACGRAPWPSSWTWWCGERLGCLFMEP